jgi:predicted metal-dependent hydrolase
MRLESSLKGVLEELKQAEVEERNARQALFEIQIEATKAGLKAGEIREFEKEPSKSVSIVDLPATEHP